MQSPSTEQSVRSTGLPTGVQAGELGRRFVAALVDWVAPALAVGILNGIAATLDPGAGRIIGTAIGFVVGLVWFVVVWWMFATRAAGPGMRLMKLQLVGLSDGRPVGWLRYLGRALILSILAATAIGLVVVWVLLRQNPRRQGLHDLAIDSVVIKERPLAPRSSAGSTSRPSAELAARTAADSASPGPDSASPGPDSVSPGVASVSPSSNSASPNSASPGPASPSPASPSPARSASTGPSAAAPSPVAHGERPDRQLNEGWVAGLDDGRDLDISGLVLLGRNPQGRPGEDAAELVKIADDTRTVSKTHLALGVDAHGMYVMDRGSTNGSTVTSAGGVSTRCPAGAVIQVDASNIVSFGDHWLEIKRSPTPEQ